ncbi:uncharacterized protein LOC127158349 [Labeo rohita]|uniref:uncharacterized protein LOC127158349 n=1 Tax=Labeo rohita TaxID=84645 RepID=UPI0021E223EB|nr:uncharacterized protein LOC127158349 [Labeo rohita]
MVKTFVFLLVLLFLSFCCLIGVFGLDAVESVSVLEGDSVTLPSNVTGMQTNDAEIMWTFGTNRSVIAKISKKTSNTKDGPDGIFKDRLKLDKQTGSLTITNTTTKHEGVYEVEISRIKSYTKIRFSITVYAATPDLHTPPKPTSDSPSGSPNFLIVLISAAAGFMLLAVGIFCICRKQRKTDQHVETPEEEITYADSAFYKRNPEKQLYSVVYFSLHPGKGNAVTGQFFLGINILPDRE